MKPFTNFDDAKREALATGGHVIDVAGRGLHVVSHTWDVERSYYHDSEGRKVRFMTLVYNNFVMQNFPEIDGPIEKIEIEPCRENAYSVDRVEDPKEADYWTIYVRINGLVMAIADCKTEKHARNMVAFLKSFARHYKEEG